MQPSKWGTASHAGSPIGALVGSAGWLMLALLLPGCSGLEQTTHAAPGSGAAAGSAAAGTPQAVVEEYLRAAGSADGAAMYALIAGSERKDETPTTLRKTAQDRYSPGMKWQVLKSDDRGSVAEVVVDIQGAKVDPDPYRFTLTREGGEWRIVQSPELHEREHEPGIHIRF